MLLKIALVTPQGTTELKELNLDSKKIETKRVDTVSLADLNLSLTLYPNSEQESLTSFIEKESKFYPIFPFESIEHDFETVNAFGFEELLDLHDKMTTRWVLNNNLKTIEQLAPTITYLKDLWVKDRNSFFEELWFLVKTNLATRELNIIFHDLKEPTTKQAEKGEKPKLCYSFVKGDKLPQIFEGKDKENFLMKEYESEFNEIFAITEFDSDKYQLTACGKIELSPILIMAEIPGLNQIQQSILVGLFNGLQ